MNWTAHPDCPAPGSPLCAFADIPDGGGFEVRFGHGDENFKVLLLRHGERVWCYLNFCPHFSLPLNFKPQTFVTFEDMVVCAHHTAFFRFEDGACVDGPCAGAGLTPLPFYRDGDRILFGTQTVQDGVTSK